jgi:hypothetical protein
VTCAAALIGFKFRDNLEAGLTASQAEPGSAVCEKAGHVSWPISRFPLLDADMQHWFVLTSLGRF